MKFPVALKEMLVTEKDVMDSGEQSEAVSETTIITLNYLAFSSEKMEIEVKNWVIICLASIFDLLITRVTRTLNDLLVIYSQNMYMFLQSTPFSIAKSFL